LGAGNETVNRRGKNFCPPGVCSLLGGGGKKQRIWCKCCGKNKAGKGHRMCEISSLREGLPEKETFDQRPEGVEEASHVVIWRRSVPSVRSRTCKGRSLSKIKAQSVRLEWNK
jgi:hypothetical protein